MPTPKLSPLGGLRVLDVSRVLAGPFCTMMLGDLGADVFKIENPDGGDDTRHLGPPFIEGESAYFLAFNRNKKSITLNLKSRDDLQVFMKIAEKSDILIENFKPGVVSKLGIDYAAVSKVNPHIIYCSISGYGQTGPYRDRVAYDLIIQGMGGLMGITGEEDRPPVRIGVAVTDIAAGMYATIAILAALQHRNKTGEGQYIDISILDCSVSWMSYMAMNYFLTGEAPGRMGSAHPNIVPYQAFLAKDGKYLNIAVANERLWKNFCRAAGLVALQNDPKYELNEKRVDNRSTLIPIIENVMSTKNRDEWLRIFQEADVPCGPVYSMDEIFSDPQVLHRRILEEVKHSKGFRLKQIVLPIRYSNIQCVIRNAPPILGEHTAHLRSLLGRSAKDGAE